MIAVNKVVLVVALLAVLFAAIMCEDDNTFLQLRRQLIDQERRKIADTCPPLTLKETKVNEALLRMKKSELDTGDAYSRNFLLVREQIEQSPVFGFIKNLPKGCSLHTHLLAGVSVDFIIRNISNDDHVYGCFNDNGVFRLKFLKSADDDLNCEWKSIKAYRKEDPSFDDFLKRQLTLTPSSVNETTDEVWNKFKNTFSTLFDLVSYRPFFRIYIYRLLEELYLDNVFYTEIRGVFMPLYDLDDTTYDARTFIEDFIGVVDEFKADHKSFLGVKYIFNMYRGSDLDSVDAALKQLLNYTAEYPDFLAGFDFIGNEDQGRDLVDFHHPLLKVSDKVKFFFHAGETKQLGRTDLNLADAILLNSSRIGHGFALVKHPLLLEMARDRNIAIELCPISNQVLKLHDDPRTHPAVTLLSIVYPVVIGNDDPSVWQSKGLSYDWYVVFMAMTWPDSGLEILKKFAMDSIHYSAMTRAEKNDAFSKWDVAWDRFLDDFLGSRDMEKKEVVVV